MKNISCPLCQQVICSISTKQRTSCFKEEITVTFYKKLAGITIKNHKRGVKIIKMNGNEAFALSGAKVGDIIERINGFPCTIGHDKVCKVLASAAQNNIQLKLVVSRPEIFRPRYSFLQSITSCCLRRVN